MTPELLGRIEGEVMAQLTNTAKQPGIRRTLLMPDGHVGYGCPVGTVAIAEDWIYPPLAGFDIGCFTADTLVPTVDGRSYPIGELAEAGQDILVYALDEDHRIVVAHATARKTRTNAPLVRVMLDNEREIVCTPDHEFMLRDGTYRQAQDLVPGISLMPFSLERDQVGYMCVRPPEPGNQEPLHAYNHKVVSVERLSHREDVYCLTVPGYGNFALDAGGFVHNCGMQVVTSALEADAISQRDLQELMADISKHIAMGTGQGFGLVGANELERYLAGGILAMIPDGYAMPDDVTRTEEPCLQPTGRQYVSHRAFERGMKTAGSLGGGNHFLEGQHVRVVDADLCQKWDLREGQFVFQIHCGSRGLGHQVGDEYLKVAMAYMKAHDIPIVHRELVGMPLDSPEGQAYLAAMYTAANFSTINRQLIMHHLREGFRRVFRVGHKKSDLRLGLLYNTPHNVTRAETLTDGTVGIVHRKGATRACPAGHPRTPPAYMETGHPVLIPSAMGMPSYILVGLPGGAVSEYSVNHGAGRQLSRAQAKKTLANAEVLRALGNVRLNQQVRAVIDEAPQAYKPIDLIIEAVEQAGLARVVARLEPLFCMKGVN
jgi:tRNA-splicing ligase RtcB (3'-phosphate/5'-hydroxy nucleic acid ligase)